MPMASYNASASASIGRALPASPRAVSIAAYHSRARDLDFAWITPYSEVEPAQPREPPSRVHLNSPDARRVIPLK